MLLLPLEQPVEGVIELGFFDRLVEIEHGSQRGGGGIGMEAAGGGQLGGWFDNAGDDHGDDQIPLGAAGAEQDRLQAGAAQSAESSGDVAVGSGALNPESVGGGDEGLAFEDPAEGVELGGGPSGKVSEEVRLTTRPS